ncbi:MAG TPA: hypothetical protein VIK13_00920 [Candidatus Limnocylindrales bacterium]
MPSIDWTNPYVQGAFVAAIIALVGVVVAALAGFGGAIVGARIGARAAERTTEASRLEAQADRQDAAVARAEVREDAAKQRFLDQRVAAIIAYLEAVDAMRVYVDDLILAGQAGDVLAVDDRANLRLARAETALHLLAPDLAVSPAITCSTAILGMVSRAAFWTVQVAKAREAGMPPPSLPDDWDDRVGRQAIARADFVMAAVRHLGIDRYAAEGMAQDPSTPPGPAEIDADLDPNDEAV